MARDRSVLLDAIGTPLRRPVVYLDLSHLSDAFAGKRGEGRDVAVHAELADVVEAVARGGTLCLADTHLIEMMQWEPFAKPHALGLWLDGLEKMWFQTNGASETELEGEVRRRLQMTNAPPYFLPIHRYVSSAIHAASEGVLTLFARPTIAAALHEVHGKLKDRADEAAAFSVRMIARLRQDRMDAPPEATPANVEERARGRLCRSLEIEAREVLEHDLPIIGQIPPDHPAIGRAVWGAYADPDALPLTKITHHVLGEARAQSSNDEDPDGKKFKKRHRSKLWDVRYALAAGVVDVFSCDGPVDDLIGKFREVRGLPRQLSIQGCGGREAFVKELRRQCAEPLEGR